MPTFTAGTSFTDGVTGDVTASKLNALVANATPLANLITDRTAETSIATDDLVLISDTSDSGALNKMTVANFTNFVSTGTGTAASPAIRPTGDTNTGIFFPAADTIAFSEGGTEAMRIDSSGNVGIGTASVASTATSGFAFLPSSTSYAYINGVNGTGSIWLGNNNDGSNASNGVNCGSISFRARHNGVYGGGSDVASIYGTYTGNGTTRSGAIRFITVDSGSEAEHLRITSGGLVLIGCTASPSSSVSGVLLQNPLNASSTFSLGSYTGSATVIAFVNGNGTIGSISVNGSATAYNTSSDYRLKTNLEPISNGIDRIKQLPVYRFNWIADESGFKVDGFVAHEAQAIVPECVTGEKDAVDADGKPIYQGIDQSKIVPLLTAALKEAIAKIETLEANNTALESRIAALEAA